MISLPPSGGPSAAATLSAPSTTASHNSGGGYAGSTVLPHNVDAERSLLSCIMLDPPVVETLGDLLAPEDFYEPRHGVLFRHLREMHEGQLPLTLDVVSESLRTAGLLEAAGGVTYVAEHYALFAPSSSAMAYARLIVDKAQLRRLHEASQRIQREVREERVPADELVQLAEKLVFDVSNRRGAGNAVDMRELMQQTIDEIHHIAANRKPLGLQTGFPDLDRVLGGIEPTALVILAARPSVGKTSFALNILSNVSNPPSDKAVLFFSLEMSALQIGKRLLCAEAAVPMSRVQRSNIHDRDLETLRNRASDLQDSKVVVDDTPGISLLTLRTRARREKARFGDSLGLIVVDYLQLMTGSSRKAENRQQEVAEISRGLKGLAKELNTPVMALSQLTRSVEQRGTKKEPGRPMLSDLRESGSIEQDADIVIFLSRKNANNPDDVDPVTGQRQPPPPTIEVIVDVAKNRNGATDPVDMIFVRNLMRFGQIDPSAKTN